MIGDVPINKRGVWCGDFVNLENLPSQSLQMLVEIELAYVLKKYACFEINLLGLEKIVLDSLLLWLQPNKLPFRDLDIPLETGFSDVPPTVFFKKNRKNTCSYWRTSQGMYSFKLRIPRNISSRAWILFMTSAGLLVHPLSYVLFGLRNYIL